MLLVEAMPPAPPPLPTLHLRSRDDSSENPASFSGILAGEVEEVEDRMQSPLLDIGGFTTSTKPVKLQNSISCTWQLRASSIMVFTEYGEEARNQINNPRL